MVFVIFISNYICIQFLSATGAGTHGNCSPGTVSQQLSILVFLVGLQDECVYIVCIIKHAFAFYVYCKLILLCLCLSGQFLDIQVVMDGLNLHALL